MIAIVAALVGLSAQALAGQPLASGSSLAVVTGVALAIATRATSHAPVGETALAENDNSLTTVESAAAVPSSCEVSCVGQ